MPNNVSYWKGRLLDARQALKSCQPQNKSDFRKAVKFAAAKVEYYEQMKGIK